MLITDILYIRKMHFAQESIDLSNYDVFFAGSNKLNKKGKKMKLLSIKQAADKLGKSRQYVWTLIKMGKILARKVGGRYVVTNVQLEKYISKKETQNEDPKLNYIINQLTERSSID